MSYLDPGVYGGTAIYCKIHTSKGIPLPPVGVGKPPSASPFGHWLQDSTTAKQQSTEQLIGCRPVTKCNSALIVGQ